MVSASPGAPKWLAMQVRVLMKRDAVFEGGLQLFHGKPLDDATTCAVPLEDATMRGVALGNATVREVPLDDATIPEAALDAKIQAVRARVGFEDEVRKVCTIEDAPIKLVNRDVPGFQQQSSRLLSQEHPTFVHQEVPTTVPFDDQNVVLDGVTIISVAQCHALVEQGFESRAPAIIDRLFARMMPRIDLLKSENDELTNALKAAVAEKDVLQNQLHKIECAMGRWLSDEFVFVRG